MTQRMRDRQWLGTAVLASILLHLVFLGASPGWRELPRLPAPIVARLSPEAASLERTAPLPQSPPELAQPLPRKRSEPKRDVMSVRETFTPAPDAPEPLQESPTSPFETSTAVVPGARIARRLETPAPTPASPAADTGSVAQYRLAIISHAKSLNRYPRFAVENNWQGRAEVRVSVGTDGTIASLGLGRGTGYEILDRQALDMIGQAAQQVSLPVSLRGREFVIEIPVIFSLAQAGRAE